MPAHAQDGWEAWEAGPCFEVSSAAPFPFQILANLNPRFKECLGFVGKGIYVRLCIYIYVCVNLLVHKRIHHFLKNVYSPFSLLLTSQKKNL